MQQCVLIAIALALHPEALIADKPAPVLDAVSGLRALELLRRLQDEGMSILLVTHDMKAVSLHADQAASLPLSASAGHFA